MSLKQLRSLSKKSFNFLYKRFPSLSNAIFDVLSEKFLYQNISHKALHMTHKQRSKAPGLLIDVSEITRFDKKTGIQRVVNSLSSEFLKKQVPGLEFIQLAKSCLVTSNEYVSRFQSITDNKEEIVNEDQGDILFLLDSSWKRVRSADRAIDRIHKKGGKVYGIVHDLFPIQYPDLFDSPFFIDTFIAWYNMLLTKGDGVICVSKTTANVVSTYYEKCHFHRKYPLDIYTFHLGTTVSQKSKFGKIQNRLVQFLKNGTVFLMVGTIEPRKGNQVAIKAIRNLLESGEDVKLLLIGNNGWKNQEVTQLYTDMNKQYPGKFLWIQGASDDELNWAYTHSDALIAASKDEGFGLPLIEAGIHGLPLICSDIPIFREVAGSHADFFKCMNEESLEMTLRNWLKSNNHPNSSKIKIYSWQESADEVLDILNGKTKPYRTLN